MTRTLLILRHAKSDWSVNVCDFDRPLKKRGKQSAEKIGNWLIEQHIFPDYIVSSSAKRASQTIKRVVNHAGMDPTLIRYQEKIYLAELPDLLKILDDIPDQAETVMLVGHNPGMDELLEYNRMPGSEVLHRIRPLQYFDEYLLNGYYPLLSLFNHPGEDNFLTRYLRKE